MDDFMEAAIAEAKKQGLQEGGIPIGSVLVKDGQVLAEDTTSVHGDPVTHAEIDCLRNAGRIGNTRIQPLFHLNALLSLRWGSCPVWD